jgi:hypothetical protein
MSGYLAFYRTGVPEVDAILSAIENAGDAYHHTEYWDEPQDHLDGKSYSDIIDEKIHTCRYALDKPKYTNTNHGVTMQDRKFSCGDGANINDDNFDFDANLKVTGDFGEGQLREYVEMITFVLNSHVALLERIKELESRG